MIRAVLPRYRTVGGDFDKFELNGFARRNIRVDKPIRIIRREQRSDCAVPGRIPVA